MKRLRDELKRIGGYIRHFKDREANVSPETIEFAFLIDSNPSMWTTFASPFEFLRSDRKRVNRLIYAEKKRILLDGRRRFEFAIIASTLRGGSTARLYKGADKRDLPLIVNPLIDPDGIKMNEEEFVAGEEKVKDLHLRYYSNLYKNPPDPVVPRPWMETPSIIEIRERTRIEPMQWPVCMTIKDLKSLLMRGNHSPSPGPD
jgi:hypothetical protein